MCYHKINTFRGEQRWMGQKEARGKSMHCMYSSMAIDTSRAEVMSSNKKLKPIALAIVETEGTRQAGS